VNIRPQLLERLVPLVGLPTKQLLACTGEICHLAYLSQKRNRWKKRTGNEGTLGARDAQTRARGPVRWPHRRKAHRTLRRSSGLLVCRLRASPTSLPVNRARISCLIPPGLTDTGDKF